MAASELKGDLESAFKMLQHRSAMARQRVEREAAEAEERARAIQMART
jgi:hypothetical protein